MQLRLWLRGALPALRRVAAVTALLTGIFWLGRGGELVAPPATPGESAVAAAWAQAYCGLDLEGLIAAAPDAYEGFNRYVLEQQHEQARAVNFRCDLIRYLGGAPETEASYEIAVYIWHAYDNLFGEQWGSRILNLEGGRIVRVR